MSGFSIVQTSAKVYSGFTPTTIPNCILWLDAADSNTITLSGSNVTQWSDKSGTSNNAITSTRFAWLGPTVTATKSLKFTRVASTSVQMLRTQVGRQTTSDVTYTIVIKPYNDGVSGSAFVDLRKGSDGQTLVNAGQTGSAYFRGATSGLYSTTLSYSTSAFNIITLQAGVNKYASYLNGTLTGSATPSLDMPSADSVYLTIGAATDLNYGVNASPANQILYSMTSEYYEVIMYNSYLTLAQIQQVEGYLAWKWGLTSNLSTTNIFKSIPLYTRPFLPVDISGCQLWLDGADTSYMTLSGSNVTQWRDKSGNGNIGNSGGTSPTYNSSNKSIVFNGTGYINNTTFSFPLANRSIFIVGNQTASSAQVFEGFLVLNSGTTLDYNSVNAIVYNGRGSNVNANCAFGVFFNYAINSGDYKVNYLTNTSPAPFAIYNDIFLTNSGTLYVNGSNIATDTTSGSIGTSTGFLIGGRLDTGSGTPSALLNGNVYEIIVYNFALSTSQRQQVEGYLATKWNLRSSFASTHPFKLYYPLTVAFLPTQISGCQLWLDGADRSSLTLSGSNVTQWNDKSGNNYTATGTVAPTYNTSTKYVIFNGSTQYFTVSNGAFPSGNNSYSMFFVAYTNNAANPQWIISGGTESTNQLIGALFYTTNAVWHSWWVNEFKVDNSITHGTAAILNLTYSTLRSIIVNGGTATTNNPSATRNNPTGPNYIGRRITSTQYLDGGIGEIIIFNSDISTYQRQQVEGYLAWKWKLQNNLPTTHAFKKFSP